MKIRQLVTSKRQPILIAIKCVISGVLIYWILRDVDLSEILIIIHTANRPMLLLAFSLPLASYYLKSHRWRVLLKVEDIDVSIAFLIKSYMVAIFFNNLLPSTIGGDVIRAYDSWRVGKSKADALAVIFIDRFLGVLALMLFTLGAMLVSKKLTANIPFLYLWVSLGTIGLLLIVWMIFVPPRQMSTFIANIRFPFSQKLGYILDKIINAFLVFQGRKDALAGALGLSLILQTNVVIYYYLLAKSLGLPVPFHYFFLIIPLALFIMMVPVSINAIGIRENVFAFFFSIFGVSNSEAVAFAWLAYRLLILHGVLGGIVYVFRK